MGIARDIKQLGSDTLVYGMSATISRVISIFLVPLYTRVFSPADYGVMAVISTFNVFVSILVVAGLDNASARWYYETQELEKKKQVVSSWFWMQMGLSLFIVLIVVVFSGPLASVLLASSTLGELLILSGLTILPGTFKKVIGNWFRYERRPWFAMLYSIGLSLATIGLTIAFVLVWRQGLPGIYWAELLSLCLMAFIAIWLFKDWISPRYISSEMLRSMLVFALPLLPAAVATWATGYADRLFLQVYSTSTEIGLYSIAQTIASAIALLTMAFQMAWMPFAYSIAAKSDAPRVYAKVLSIGSLLGCAVATALSLFAPLILQLLTTPQYAGAASCVSFLAFSNLAIAVSYIAMTGPGIAKKSLPISISIFLGAGVNLLVNILLIPRFGKEGAAISTLVAYLAAAGYLFIASQKIRPFPYRFLDVLILLVFSWIVIGVDHFLLPGWDWSAVLMRIGLCALFIPLAFLLRIVRVKDISSTLKYMKLSA